MRDYKQKDRRDESWRMDCLRVRAHRYPKEYERLQLADFGLAGAPTKEKI